MLEEVYQTGRKVWWVLYVLGMLVPVLLLVLGGQSLSKPINTTAINGLITASGIFLGFLTASIINKSELVDFDTKYAIYVDIVLFSIALIFTYSDILYIDTALSRDLVLIMTSLIAEMFTAFAVVRSVLKGETKTWIKEKIVKSSES